MLYRGVSCLARSDAVYFAHLFKVMDWCKLYVASCVHVDFLLKKHRHVINMLIVISDSFYINLERDFQLRKNIFTFKSDCPVCGFMKQDSFVFYL